MIVVTWTKADSEKWERNGNSKDMLEVIRRVKQSKTQGGEKGHSWRQAAQVWGGWHGDAQFRLVHVQIKPRGTQVFHGTWIVAMGCCGWHRTCQEHDVEGQNLSKFDRLYLPTKTNEKYGDRFPLFFGKKSKGVFYSQPVERGTQQIHASRTVPSPMRSPGVYTRQRLSWSGVGAE